MRRYDDDVATLAKVGEKKYFNIDHYAIMF